MKRNPNIIRRIILTIENYPLETISHKILVDKLYEHYKETGGDGAIEFVDEVSCDPSIRANQDVVAVIEYHIHILKQSPLLEFATSTNNTVALSLTWQGHEFAALVGNTDIWNSTTQAVRDSGLDSIPFDTLFKLYESNINKNRLMK